MSVSASIDVSISSRSNKKLSCKTIIENLLDKGWNILNKGQIYYLPLGDDGDFDWIESKIDKEDFYNVVNQKEQAKEIVGVSLIYKDTDTGINLLIFPTYKLTFSLICNRKVFKDNITDVNWYLEKIMPCFDTDDVVVECFAFIQD